MTRSAKLGRRSYILKKNSRSAARKGIYVSLDDYQPCARMLYDGRFGKEWVERPTRKGNRLRIKRRYSQMQTKLDHFKRNVCHNRQYFIEV